MNKCEEEKDKFYFGRKRIEVRKRSLKMSPIDGGTPANRQIDADTPRIRPLALKLLPN